MAAPATDLRAAPANDLRAAPATDVRAAPATDVRVAPATDVRAAPANDVIAAPETDVRAAPATDVRAVPATDVRAAPATDVRAAPVTDVRAASAIDVRAAPSNTVRTAPSNTVRAAPATDMRAAPATDVRAHRHEDRPVLDNWIQVVNKPKREAQGRGEVCNDNTRCGRGKRASYASTIIGKATGLHIRAAKRSAHIFVSRLDPGLRCDELADHLKSVLHLRPTVELVKATDTYASFRLSCEYQDPNVFLDANIIMARRVVGTLVARATDQHESHAT